MKLLASQLQFKKTMLTAFLRLTSTKLMIDDLELTVMGLAVMVTAVKMCIVHYFG